MVLTSVPGYDECDATDLATLVRRRLASPEELLDEAWQRTLHANPIINAVVWADLDTARAQARSAPAEGPFAGVPFLVKDIFAAVRGFRSSAGARLLKDSPPASADSELIARHRSAGFVFFGKTTTPELAMSPTTEAAIYGGPTRNPWNVEFSPGGSSGGAAAAVAAGIIPIAHASDGGGSIRIPASACGLFGLKPTRGRNPVGPDAGEILGGLGAEHAISRSVRDSAILLDHSQGMDAGAPYAAPHTDGTNFAATSVPPRRLRIGLLARASGHFDIHEDCEQAVADTARLCEQLGHAVAPMELPFYDRAVLLEAHNTLLKVGAGAFLKAQQLAMGRPVVEADVEPFTWRAGELSAGVSGEDYARAIAVFHRFGRRLATVMAQFDVLLTPSLLQPPPRIGAFAPDLGFEQFRQRVADYTGFLTIANYTGLPAMSVPLHWNAEGLPIGSQFIGRWADEKTLFSLAAQLERSRPWFSKRPHSFQPGGVPCRGLL
jgi:amidase